MSPGFIKSVFERFVSVCLAVYICTVNIENNTSSSVLLYNWFIQFKMSVVILLIVFTNLLSCLS